MRPFVPVFLLACMLAGCADTSPADTVMDAFDEVQRLPANVTEAAGLPAGLAVIQSSAILGSVDGTTWSTRVVHQPPAAAHNGDQPPAQPDGGGSRIDLVPPAGATLFARLATNSSLDGLDVVWAAVRGDLDGSAIFLGNTTGNGVLEVPFPIGPNAVYATIMDGDKPVAVTGLPLRIGAIVEWQVRDSVHPVNPNGVAPLSEDQRTARADRYHVPAGLAGTLSVQTAFDGTWTPNQGTDVDLEFLQGTKSVQCIGTGGASGPVPVDPAQSAENGQQAIGAQGDWVVRIGYVSSACGAFYYHNAGPVPYRATILLDTT